MNFQELEARRVQTLADIFQDAAKQIPPDRAEWKPDEGVRSAQEIVAHLAETNRMFAGMIAGGRSGGGSEIHAGSYGDALDALRESVRVVTRAIASVPDGELRERRRMPWGGEWKVTTLIASPASHIAYHWGQIAFLQRLQGDTTDYHLLPDADWAR